MRSLIRAHPTMTVHELAEAMGYSEDRSIYYWLRKAGHKGLRDFKAEILAERRYETEPTRSAIDLSDFSGAGYTQSVHVVRTSEYVPWLLPGDRLVLDQDLPLEDGRLVHVQFDQHHNALRRYIAGPPRLLLHPTNPREVTRLESETAPLLTSVARVIRDSP